MTNEQKIAQLEAQIKGQRDAIVSLMNAIQRLACYIEYRDAKYDLAAAVNDDWRDEDADKITMEGVWHEAFKAFFQSQLNTGVSPFTKQKAKHPPE